MLPLATEAAPMVALPPDRRPAAAAGRRVLLVVPDPDLVVLFRGELEQDGVEPEVASGGWDALDRIARHPPDLVVAHAELQDMHGLEFMQHLRALPEVADLPTILVGGDPAPDRATAYGADAWIAAEAATVAAEVRRLGTAPRRPVILFVEDDPALRGALARLIRRQGFAVVEASNGTAGLDLARRRVPDAVALDYQLPGMSGLDLLRALRAEPALRAVPALLMSGHSSPQILRETEGLGAAFLAKPMDWTVIVRAIAQLVRGPSAPATSGVLPGNDPDEGMLP
jgi:CheY-like chemotaxis protein